jgi:hypothetical protein
MAKAASISLSGFSASVQAAVKAAVAKHPKFSQLEVPSDVTFSYSITGIPVPEPVAKNLNMGELQAFADDVAERLVSAQPHAAERLVLSKGSNSKGAVYSAGHHVICGIPPFMPFAER